MPTKCPGIRATLQLTSAASLCLAAILTLASTLPVQAATGGTAATIQHVYEFDPGCLHAEPTGLAGTLTVLHAGSLPRTWEEGQPELPYDVVTFLIPQRMRIAQVRARGADETVLLEAVPLAPAAPQYTEEGLEVMPPAPRLGKPASPIYPPALAETAGQSALHGYVLASVRIYPVRYEAALQRTFVSKRIALEIELAPGSEAPLSRERWSASIEERATRVVRGLVANPEAIETYGRRIGVRVTASQRGFHPTDAPTLEGSPVDYVIVTSDLLAPSFQVLADWKTRRGVPTVVRTLSWIEANYRHGSDQQETIRNFIKDAYAKWSVRYVLLGGDTDVLPARYGYSAYGPETERYIPTDMYFACLDGNWNADGDASWGEAVLSAEDLVDETDMYAEVFIGRLPVTTVAEADHVINKILGYENPADGTWQGRLLTLAEVLFPVDWEPGQTIQVDGAAYSESLLVHVNDCSAVTRLYENYTAYPGASELTLGATLAAINSSYGFVNHIGHGYRYNMSCGDVSLTNNDTSSLTNVDRHFVLYMLNCTATAFDYPCLAEAFLMADGGCVAVLGSSRAAFALPARNYNVGFFTALYDSGYVHIGETFVHSRLRYTPSAGFDTSDHYTHYLYNMLADPEMVIQTCSLATTAVSFPDTLSLGINNVVVHVDNNGMPRQGALVCLQKGDEEYVFGETDGGGDVTLEFIAESGGTIDVTVSGHNMTLFQGMATVDAGAATWVSVASMTLDDDGTGLSDGNGDATLDAGETVEVSAVLRNAGGSPTAPVSGVLRVDSPWVTVLDSVYTAGSIGAGGTTPIGGLRIQVGAATPDGTVLGFEFVSQDSVSSWSDLVRRVAHAAQPELTLLDIADPAPGGNGDGVIQAGETFDVSVYLKNYGTGMARNLAGTLQSTDPDIVLVDSAATFGDLATLQEVATSSPFRLTELTVDENPLLLSVTDAYGSQWSWTVTLRPPTAPTGLKLDASQGFGVVVAEWNHSASSDVAGYHLYRATQAMGPWTRISNDRTDDIAYFRDTGLAPSTQYFYYATAVDSSGNESAPGLSADINTNPAQLSGWPILMGNVSSCPPAAGDITGDGQKEIIAGNDHLYAWGWDAIELRDDDEDPQTWGVFAAEIGTVTAALVLAEFDLGSPGLEIFATSWTDSNRTYVVRGDGSIPPGWPQQPDGASAQTGYWGSPAAIDLDGDLLVEVFAPGKNGNLYAWHADGSPVGAQAAFKTGLGTWTRCSPTLANLDGDPEPEIVYVAPNATLHIWNCDGSYMSANYPKSLGTLCLSSSAIGDVNDDGILDIVMLAEDDFIHVINSATGYELPGWPVALNMKSNPIAPSPALADFDFDGQLEIVVANNHTTVALSAVHVYNSQGIEQPGWPQYVGSKTSESSPIVADVSGDGVPDIMFGNEGGFIYGWDKDGNKLVGFPLTIGDFVRSTPYADDVDNDGDIDLVFSGWDQNLWIWDFTAPYNDAAAQWPTLKHDLQRTGYYGFRDRGNTATDTGQPATQAPPATASLAQNMPNPFNPSTHIHYGVPATAGGKTPVRLEIFDVRGRLVRQLVQGEQAPGIYNALWDGRDERGRRVQSGVYFYRLQVAADVLTRKMLLTK